MRLRLATILLSFLRRGSRNAGCRSLNDMYGRGDARELARRVPRVGSCCGHRVSRWRRRFARSKTGSAWVATASASCWPSLTDVPDASRRQALWRACGVGPRPRTPRCQARQPIQQSRAASRGLPRWRRRRALEARAMEMTMVPGGAGWSSLRPARALGLIPTATVVSVVVKVCSRERRVGDLEGLRSDLNPDSAVKHAQASLREGSSPDCPMKLATKRFAGFAYTRSGASNCCRTQPRMT